MKSCKFFYSPIKKEQMLYISWHQNISTNLGLKKKKKSGPFNKHDSPRSICCGVYRYQNRLNFEEYTVIFQCFRIEEISLKKITKRKLTKQIQTIHFSRSMRNIIHIVVTVKYHLIVRKTPQTTDQQNYDHLLRIF